MHGTKFILQINMRHTPDSQNIIICPVEASAGRWRFARKGFTRQHLDFEQAAQQAIFHQRVFFKRALSTGSRSCL